MSDVTNEEYEQIVEITKDAVEALAFRMFKGSVENIIGAARADPKTKIVPQEIFAEGITRALARMAGLVYGSCINERGDVMPANFDKFYTLMIDEFANRKQDIEKNKVKVLNEILKNFNDRTSH